MKILLLGNPNVGKSAFFSRITGVKVIASNYPGTTVEFKKGSMKLGEEEAGVIDVPGSYTLEPTSKAEDVAVEMLKDGDLAINVVDATNLERNLYLTLELLERQIPVIVALNMWYDTAHRGINIDVAKLEKLLSRYYVEPKVEVQVASYESKKIYVFGQVNGQGPKRFTGRDTVMDVLADAQPTVLAWGARVRVIRPNANPEEIREITVNVDRMMEDGDLRGNFLLQAGDIVYVPPTPLGWVGLRIQEVLFPFSPLISGYAWPANVASAANVYDDFGERSAGGMRGLGAGGNGFGNKTTGGWGE